MIQIIAYFIGSVIAAAMILTPTGIAWLRDHHARKTVATINILGLEFIPFILLLPFMIAAGGFDDNSKIVFVGWFLFLASCVWIADIIWASLGRKSAVLMSSRRKALTLATITVALTGVTTITGFMSGTNSIFHSEERLAVVPKKAADLDSGPNASIPWKRVDDWIIRFDQSEANSSGEMNGCFMFRTFGDAVIRIGFYAPSNDYLILFSNDTLSSTLEKGRSYDMILQFGNKSPWSVEAKALVFPGSDNLKVLGFRINSNPKFFTELTEQPTLDILQEEMPILHFNLSGSRAAFHEMLSCQESHNKKPEHL